MRWALGVEVKRHWRIGVFLPVLTLAAAAPHEARAESETHFHDAPPEFKSAHGLGMGGTGVSFTRGLDAAFVNPAGIAQSKSILSEIVLVSPLVTVGDEGRKLYKDIDAGTDTYDMIAKYQNKPQHVGVQNVTGISFKRAAFGLLQSGQVDVFAGTDPTSPLPIAEVRAIARAGVYLSSARAFLSDDLLVGVTTKVVQKRELSLRLSALEAQEKMKGSSSKALLNENMKQGTGIGADIGVQYRVSEMDTKPTFGVVGRNLGLRYGWGVPKGKKAPSAEKPTVDVGLSLEPGTKRSTSRVAIDFVDAANAYKLSPYKRIHLGAELSFQNVLGAMAGIGGGYPSFGAYMNIKILRIEGGVYGEELGKQPGDLRSRRYFARVSLGWLQ